MFTIPKPLLVALICTPIASAVLFLLPNWSIVARTCLALFACIFVAAVISRWGGPNRGSSALYRGGPGGAAARQPSRSGNAAARSPSRAPAAAAKSNETSPVKEDQTVNGRRSSIEPLVPAPLVAVLKKLETKIETGIENMTGTEKQGPVDEKASKEATDAAQTEEDKNAINQNRQINKLNEKTTADYDAEVKRLTKEAQAVADSQTSKDKEDELKRASDEAESTARSIQDKAQKAEDEEVAERNTAKAKEYNAKKKAFDTQGGKITALLKGEDTAATRAKLRGFLNSDPKERGQAASAELTRSNAKAWLERNKPQEEGINQMLQGFKERKDWNKFNTTTIVNFIGSSNKAVDQKDKGYSESKTNQASEIFSLIQTPTDKGQSALIEVYRTLVNNKFEDVEPPLTPKELKQLEAMAKFDEKEPEKEKPKIIALTKVAPKIRAVAKVAAKPIVLPKLELKANVTPKIVAAVKILAKPDVKLAPSIVKTNVKLADAKISLLPLLAAKVKTPPGKTLTQAQKQLLAKQLMEAEKKKYGGDEMRTLVEGFRLDRKAIEKFIAGSQAQAQESSN